VIEFPHDALVKLDFLKKIVDAHTQRGTGKMGALVAPTAKPFRFTSR